MSAHLIQSGQGTDGGPPPVGRALAPRPSGTRSPFRISRPLQATAGDRQVALSWTASTDPDSAVAGYYVYRGGTRVANVTGTSYTDIGLADGTTYSYTVSAYDPAGNVSAQSSAVTATAAGSSSAPPLAGGVSLASAGGFLVVAAV